MPLSNEQRRDLLLAERCRDAATIRGVLQAILRDNKSATLLDCEMALREAAAKTYLVAVHGELVMICFSLADARAALAAAGLNPGDNWIALTERIDSGPDRTV
jgi:hypothetical protein